MNSHERSTLLMRHFYAAEKSAEKTVSEIFMYRILIESGFPVLLAMFIGPLTDRFGYKNLICYSLFGYCLFAASYMLSVLVPNLLPKLLLLASIPLALTGGPVLLFIASYAYLASQTNSENRSYRMAALTAVYDLGTVGGYVCGSQVRTEYAVYESSYKKYIL